MTQRRACVHDGKTSREAFERPGVKARFAASGLGSASRATSSALTDIICRIARSEGCG